MKRSNRKNSKSILNFEEIIVEYWSQISIFIQHEFNLLFAKSKYKLLPSHHIRQVLPDSIHAPVPPLQSKPQSAGFLPSLFLV